LTRLHHADDANAAHLQVTREVAQDRVRILMLIVDESSEVALSVKHGLSPRNHIGASKAPSMTANFCVAPAMEPGSGHLRPGSAVSGVLTVPW